jgi:hypothetical protein
MEDVDEARAEIRDLREELRDTQMDLEDVHLKFVELTHAVEKLAMRMEHEREMAERNQREPVLRLELTLERFQRRLPPAMVLETA